VVKYSSIFLKPLDYVDNESVGLAVYN